MAYQQDAYSQTKNVIVHIYTYFKTLTNDYDKSELGNLIHQTRKVTVESCGVSLACVK